MYITFAPKFDTLKKIPDEILQWVHEFSQSGSEAAFKSLYVAYFQRLMRFVIPYVSTPQEAEEIVSDSFIALWENRKSLFKVSNVEAYLYTITRNKTISYLRSLHAEETAMEESVDSFLYTETTPEDELISKEGVERLNAAINSLPEKCKIVFQLVREDKMKYKDVARILNISIKTVETHITTAVKKLRECLSSEI
jgi:RNA polymerase sigma-70 factor (ECF subfamily)